MADVRTPEGWLSASRMSGMKYMFLEGTSDERFWKLFIDDKVIIPTQVKGWKNVVACVSMFNDNNVKERCIGIVDRDFEDIFPHKEIEAENIFMTDVHDIELMMYESPAWEIALVAINKHCASIPSHRKILDEVYSITDRIGYLKLTSLKHSLNLQFKHQNKDREIELPKLEKLLDKNSEYDYLGDSNMINYLYDYSRGQINGTNIASKDSITKAFNEEILREYHSHELSNGHDVSYLMHYILKKKYLTKHKGISVDLVETALLAAYGNTFLQQTRLYGALEGWTTSNNLKIFRF